jgi:hypothetical protein
MAIEEIDQIDLASNPSHMERKRKRGMLFLGIACAAMGLAGSLQTGLNDNFVVNVIGITGYQKGILEAIRESCGIFALGLLALLSGLAEPLIGAAMILVFGLGLSAYAGVHSFFWLTAFSLVWSQGLHIWMPLPNSMMMSLAEKGKTGHRLGQLGAAGAFGGVGGLVLALILTSGLHISFLHIHVPGAGVPLRLMYLVAGGAAILAAAACLGIPRDIKTPGPRFIVRRRYGLYYMLCFLEGWRKQIFMAFAGFLLVNNYGMSLETMLSLWITVGIASWFLSPRVGKLIDRLGERRILTAYYVCLTGVFCGYAFIRNRYVLAGLFMTDNIFFTLGMALTTYVRRLAPPEEHTPTLSMGVAMNHVAAVTMPLVGGFLWTLNYRWVFGMGATAAAMSILAVSRLPAKGQAVAGAKAAP